MNKQKKYMKKVKIVTITINPETEGDVLKALNKLLSSENNQAKAVKKALLLAAY